jgi:hypothetical protein
VRISRWESKWREVYIKIVPWITAFIFFSCIFIFAAQISAPFVQNPESVPPFRHDLALDDNS